MRTKLVIMPATRHVPSLLHVKSTVTVDGRTSVNGSEPSATVLTDDGLDIETSYEDKGNKPPRVVLDLWYDTNRNGTRDSGDYVGVSSEVELTESGISPRSATRAPDLALSRMP